MALVLLLVAPEEHPERFWRVAVSADRQVLTEALKAGDEEAALCPLSTVEPGACPEICTTASSTSPSTPPGGRPSTW